MTTPTRDRGPGVDFPPPLVYVLGFGLGAFLERVLPSVGHFPEAMWFSVTGLIVFAVGIVLAATGMITFRLHKTTIYPNQPARNLVTTGIYAHTRNPMYVGLAIAYLGGVLATGLVWPLCLLPAVMGTIQSAVIAREERHLHARFPEEYAEYASRVRRWV